LIPLGLRIALRHLTVLPIPYDPAEASASPARALAWFPVVGAVIGLAVGGTLMMPFPPWTRGALGLAVWIWLSGALHEDGVMDCADAALAPVPRERRLEILKDPHVGAFAVVAEGTLLLVRAAALASVTVFAPVVAALSGRWVMALSLALWRPARPDGLGARFASGARGVWPTVCALVLLGVVGAVENLVSVGTPRVLLAAVASLVAGLGGAWWLDRRFGGLTGDAHGAASVLAETAALLVYAWGCGVGACSAPAS
jgi:adenosylcobinamide-GDP ribazoletransferase